MSSSHHKSPSLSQAFDNLKIESTSYKIMNLPQALVKTIRAKLPRNAKFTIKFENDYDYNRFTAEPEEAFDDSIKHLERIQNILLEDDQTDSSYEEHLVESMIQMIFSSNVLESAGGSYATTLRLCKAIFAGEDVGEIGERDKEEYKDIEAYLRAKNTPVIDREVVLRSRKQITQHALALKYITQKIVLNREPLSEKIVKETHQILTSGINAENEDEDRSESYGRSYRKVQVVWELHQFPSPNQVPGRMLSAIRDFNEEMQSVETSGSLDPFQFATKHYHRILYIHPFLDGNSRLCRLLLNDVLLKYTGIIIPIATDPVEIAKWKDTAVRAADFDTQGTEETLKKPWFEMATLVAFQGSLMLENLSDRLTARKKKIPFLRRKSIVKYPWKVEEDDSEDEMESVLKNAMLETE